MTVLKLIDEQDERLKQVCAKHEIDDATEKLVYDMIVTMQDNDGIGLAAPQLGVMEQIFVIGHKDAGFVVCINPSWVPTTDAKLEKFQEGCLSFPHLALNIERYNQVHCTFTKLKGETQTRLFNGVWAQAIQHEHDHLMGITFDKRAKTSQLSRALAKRREKLKRIKKRSND